MTLSPEILKELRQFNKNVEWLKAQAVKNRGQWVKVSVVRDLTGWDKEQMRRMRESGGIEVKKENGIWYNLNSINPIHLKQTA